ncbi:MAG TPA: hypothetical protein VIV58_31040 [Kofleriaceae bacterium]
MRTLTLALVLACGSAHADAPPPEWTADVVPRIGVVAPTSKLGVMVVGGVQLDYLTPALDHRFAIGLDLSLTRPSHGGDVMDPRLASTAQYTVAETEVVIALLASYRFAGHDATVVPWIAAGPMLHLLRSTESTSIAPGDNTAVSSEPGVEVAGGFDHRLAVGFLVGELRAGYSKLDHAITGNTNAGSVALAVGYRLVF